MDFDSYDVTVDELIRRFSQKRIEIAPVYQRQFRWAEKQQSELVESLLLGIPVPPLFMATNSRSAERVQWEVVDGLQRLLTLVNFAGDAATRRIVHPNQPPLKLTKLDKLKLLNGYEFSELPVDIGSLLMDRPMKVVVLNDKSDLQVRFDLFERLNTGGVALTQQEVRSCIYRGPFMDFIEKCAKSDRFLSVIRLPENRMKDGTPEDFTLRFFAFYYRYQLFDHSVKDFLNDFAKEFRYNTDTNAMDITFEKTFSYLAKLFPDGIKTRKGQTPVNLFEAISVGAALAITQEARPLVQNQMDWVTSSDLRSLTTGATNSRARVVGRIEFCRDRFLGRTSDV
ncbi:DUF262 domain-containing protein [Acidisphaera rubrifaciens]|uniref:DUF262 domain-containing protein n=1 Tax=Acidisphaera rubrifaciens TaxID=50715 RepID=UPI00130E0C4E|nr:DUF262 domain-containing protein [Acidisphaera rubrifaciens]